MVVFTDVIQCGCGNEDAKEITFPELRDLVVLKRNSIDDATHTDGHYSFYVGKDKNYFFSGCDKAWRGTWKNVDILKPIEKPMKEYLIKSGDGKYLLTHHDSIGAIEIPDGTDFVTEHTTGTIHFWRKGSYKTNGNNHDWIDMTCHNEKYDAAYWCEISPSNIIWQRHTLPEELPFIDDEPLQSLNDQCAEIEKVRQSHRTASEIADSALKHIRERAETYDQPTGERSAAKTAKAFNAITGKDITESEVWLLLQLLKDVRQWSRKDYHQDSAEDCIAYAALKAESLEGGE